MDKIKEFFSKTWVKVVGWVMTLVGAVTLIVGGVTTGEVASGIELAAGIISGIGALVAFITSKVKKVE